MVSKRLALTGAALIGWAGSASATATLTCDIDDRVVAFSIMAAIGHVTSVSAVQGSLELKKIGSPPPGKIDLTDDHLVQKWIDEPDLRLWVHQDGDGKSPEIDLVIITRQKSEFDFSGQYRLKVRSDDKVFNHEGRVSCGLG